MDECAASPSSSGKSWHPHTLSPGKQISNKEDFQAGTHPGLGTGPALRVTSFALHLRAWPAGTCMFAPETWPVGTYMPSAWSASTGKRGASAYASCARQVGTCVNAPEALGLTGRSTHGVEHKGTGADSVGLPCLSSFRHVLVARLRHARFQLAAPWRQPCLMHGAGLRSRAWRFLAEIPRLGTGSCSGGSRGTSGGKKW